MGMQTCHSTLVHCTRSVKWVVTPTAELIPALGTAEVHTAAPGQSVLEPTVGTSDPIVTQVSSQTLLLVLGVVLSLPQLELLTRKTLVLVLPRFFALSTEAFPALQTGDLELIAIIDEAVRAMAAPQELWVLDESLLSQFLVEELIHVLFKAIPKLYVQSREVAVKVLRVINVRLSTDRTNHVSDVFVPHCYSEMLLETSTAH